MMSASWENISVVVPAYNAESVLAETLLSIMSQTYQHWECVIVDDGSVDNTAEIAKNFSDEDKRFRLVTKDNGGTGSAYNAGVSASISDYVCICSADDLLLDDHLENLLREWSSKSEAGLVTSNGFYLYQDGRRELCYSETSNSVPEFRTLEQCISGCPFGVGAGFKKSYFERVGGFREDVYGEDWDFWLRIMAVGARHLYVPQATSVHRISAHQKTQNFAKVYASDIEILENLRSVAMLSCDEDLAISRAIKRRKVLIKRRYLGKPYVRMHNFYHKFLSRKSR